MSYAISIIRSSSCKSLTLKNLSRKCYGLRKFKLKDKAVRMIFSQRMTLSLVTPTFSESERSLIVILIEGVSGCSILAAIMILLTISRGRESLSNLRRGWFEEVD